MIEPGVPAFGDIPDLLLVGAAHVDRIGRSSVRFRRGASNPGVLRQSVGGASFNAAVALRSFGARVRLVSARGGDVGAMTVEAELVRHGVLDDGIVWLDRATASYTAILDETGELVAGIADMAIYDMLTARVLARRHIRDAFAAAPVVLMDANLSAATIRTICLQTTGLRGAIAVSPEKVVRLRDALPHLDLVFLSLAEARALTGCAGTRQDVAASLRERGVRRAIVTDGPREVLALDGSDTFQQKPAEIADIRDVTGAGDTVAAVTLLEYAKGGSLSSALRLGLAASALRITTGLAPGAAAEAARLADALPPPIPLTQDHAA